MKKLLPLLILLLTINKSHGQGFFKDLKYVELRISNPCLYFDYTYETMSKDLDGLCESIKSTIIGQLKSTPLELVDHYDYFRSDDRGGMFSYRVRVERYGPNLYKYDGVIIFEQDVRDYKNENLTTIAITWRDYFNDDTDSEFEAKEALIEGFNESIKDFLIKYHSSN